MPLQGKKYFQQNLPSAHGFVQKLGEKCKKAWARSQKIEKPEVPKNATSQK